MNKLKLCWLACLFLFTVGLQAQTTYWQRTLNPTLNLSGNGGGDRSGYAIAVDSYGNSYVAGAYRGSITFGSVTLISTNTPVSGSSYDVFITKTDNQGNLIWAVSLGGSLSADIVKGLAIDGSGNIYVTGYFYGTSSVFGTTTLTSSGGYDIFVAKINSSGVVQWATKAGGPANDTANAIAIDSSSNIYIAGSFAGSATWGASISLTGSGNTDIFAAKISSSGTWQWAKKAGGTGEDSAYGIALDSSANLYLSGSFRSTATFGSASVVSSGYNDIFVAKLDNTGSTWQWVSKAGGTREDEARGIILDSSANVYICGSFSYTATFGSVTPNLVSSRAVCVMVASLNSSGTWQWAKKAGGTSSGTAKAIAIDSSSNLYVTGGFRDSVTFNDTLQSREALDIFVAKITSSGTWLYGRQAGGV